MRTRSRTTIGLLCAGILVTSSAWAGASGTIETVAGGWGVGDDGIPATSAILHGPRGVALDNVGTLYIADTWNGVIRKVDTLGAISTVSGERLSLPQDVTVDSVGNLFIADTYSHRVRKIDTSGKMTTVAGNGSQGFSGDGGPATSASLEYPTGLAWDSLGNLFIADYKRVRRVDTSGNITTVAGGGLPVDVPELPSPIPASGVQLAKQAEMRPTDIGIDSSDNLIIADYDHHRILKVDTLGLVTTVAGNGTQGYSGDGGPATSASLRWPSGVALDADDTIYIADGGNNRIRKIDNSGMITTVAGYGSPGFSGDGGNALSANLRYPARVALDAAGSLFIADTYNNRIRKVDPSGTITTVAGGGVGDGSRAIQARLYDPQGVALGSSGELFIADKGHNRIRKIDPAGKITTVAGIGEPGFSGDGGPATSARLNAPSGVALDSSGNLYVADSGNFRIRKVDSAGNIATVAGVGGWSPSTLGDGGQATLAWLYYPKDVTVDAFGNLYIADSFNSRIRKVDTLGIITTVAGTDGAYTSGFSGDGGPATSARLKWPSGLTLDSVGNLLIADSGNNRIRKVDAAGMIITVAGSEAYGYPWYGGGDGGPATSASLWNPSGVEIDSLGNLLIADTANRRIRKVDASGIITTFAGNGDTSFYGDGGPATSASLLYPTGLAVDTSNNIFFTDSGNHRVRLVYS